MLLAGSSGHGWRSAARAAASDLGVPVGAYRIGDGGDLTDEGGRFAETYGIDADGAVLVRPDGFIAWRARSAHAESARVLTDVLSRVLARPTATGAGRSD